MSELTLTSLRETADRLDKIMEVSSPWVHAKLTPMLRDAADVIEGLEHENAKLQEKAARLFDKTLELATKNAKLHELVLDMYACISHANEQDWFYFERDKLGCGMSCTFNGEACGLCALADRMRELGVEVSK